MKSAHLCPTIFISSADSYSDLWPIFFDMFYKYWPNFRGEIFLNTEMKNYKHHSLNVTCTQVGKQDHFGSTFRAGLDQIKSDSVLLIMIDYIFMGKVDVEKIEEYYSFFKSNELDSLCLVHQNYRLTSRMDSNKDIDYVAPPSVDMFSYQIAFWKKCILYEMALPHENPWASEWYGTRRANKIKIKLACLSKGVKPPIPYDLAGCLHKGKWLENAIAHLKSINYYVNFRERGYFIKQPQTMRVRMKIKWMLISSGLHGSYWDFIKR